MSDANEQTVTSAGQTVSSGHVETEARLVREAWRQVGDAVDKTLVSPGSTAGAKKIKLDLPGYRLVREVSRGGQGVVFLAVQEATKRNVAIKVMLHGAIAGERERRRFEREVEILAQLRHPNIVTIHDSGVVNSLFYCVMDYIPGSSLDHYVVANELDLVSALKLFGKIATAVNAAHRMGVLHRDLKPGNIRVGEDGEPHVLDFGLAKATGLGDAEAPQLSMTGQFLGSLPWASPEQAIGVPAKIDLRTDVYALGVILYQMLTGAFPYSIVGPMNEVIDNILYTPPTPPSKLRRQVDHEVETILLKCLNKDAERRYQSAGELARDIDNYLEGRPIEAKRDSLLYVMQKHARRHQFQTAVLFLMLLIIITTSAIAIDLGRQLWTANDRVRDSQMAAMTNAVLLDRAVGENTLPAVRQMAIGWFIAARESGRLERQNEIRDALPLGCPARLVLDYWLDEALTGDDLLRQVGPSSEGLAHFAIGMRALWDGDGVSAKRHLTIARGLRLLPMIDREAASQLKRIEASTEGGR